MHIALNLQLPVNRTGTFRFPLRHETEELLRVGMNKLRPFRRSTNAEGLRSFSSPIDGRAFEAYSHAIGGRRRVLCIDIYEDGVAFPSSGTKTMSPVRLRF